jgi:hypothetical protein
MFQIKLVEKIKIHVLGSITFFFLPEKRAVCEIMSRSVVEQDRPQMTVWRRVACWISKPTRAQAHASDRAPTPTSTHTHTEVCETYCYSTATMVS